MVHPLIKNRNDGQANWLSAHLFYEGEANALLRDGILPLITVLQRNALLHRFFFIRYNQSGNHIRLRLQVDKANEPACKQQLEEHLWHRQLPGDHQPSSFRISRIEYVPYQPEWERYGGRTVLPAAEQQFAACSEITLALLQTLSTTWNKSSELITALKMNTVLLLSWNFTQVQMMEVCNLFVLEWLPNLYDPAQEVPAQQHYFVSQFRENFERYKAQLVPALEAFMAAADDHFSEDPLMAAYHKANQQVNTGYVANGVQLAERYDIVTSFMHMTHNRLGVPNAEESYVVYLLYKCLESIAAHD